MQSCYVVNSSQSSICLQIIVRACEGFRSEMARNFRASARSESFLELPRASKAIPMRPIQGFLYVPAVYTDSVRVSIAEILEISKSAAAVSRNVCLAKKALKLVERTICIKTGNYLKSKHNHQIITRIIIEISGDLERVPERPT